MSHLKKLKDTGFLFITGIEGSGTTMMLRLLDEVEEVAVLGGNYWTPELDKEAQMLNRLTEMLWDENKSYSLEDKEGIIREIRGLELPSYYTHVVHKRSFPFLDRHHFPHIIDCREISADFRVLNMNRDHTANTLSILRRKFEVDFELATERTGLAVRRLADELNYLESGVVLNIDYEGIINVSQKDELLRVLADFINLDRDLLKKNAHIITGPTPMPLE